MRRLAADHNPAQSRKFIEAAKRLGVDQSGKAFSEALTRSSRRSPKVKLELWID